MRNTPVLPCLLLLLCAARSSAEDRMMSIRETIDFVMVVYHDSVSVEAVEKSRRANPSARPALYRILEDPSQHDKWARVVGSFTYLGQSADVAKLEAFVLSRQGVLSDSEFVAVRMLPDAYGGMGARGVSAAAAKLKEMMGPAYWERARFQLRPEQPPGYPSFVNDMRIAALRGYSFVLANDFDTVAQALTDSVNDPREREIVKREVEEVVGLERAYRKSR
jgi:hypothetical protein